MTTLTFFYLMFPMVLPVLQTLSNTQLITLSVRPQLVQSLVTDVAGVVQVWLYHLQLWPNWLVLAFSGEYFGSGRWLSLSVTWLVKAHPLTRLPVFLMGVCLGLVRVSPSPLSPMDACLTEAVRCV